MNCAVLVITLLSFSSVAFNIAAGISALVIGYYDSVNVLPGYPINLHAWLIIYGIHKVISIIALLDLLKYTPFCPRDENGKVQSLVKSGASFAFVWLIWGTVLIARGQWTFGRLYILAKTLIIIDWTFGFVVFLLALITMIIAKKNEQ